MNRPDHRYWRGTHFAALVVALALAAAACGGDGATDTTLPGAATTVDPGTDATTGPDTTQASGGGSDGLRVMIGSSGEAETSAVVTSVNRWYEETGIPVEVIPAQDLVQQLTQGFAGGNPPDIFYMDPIRTQQFGSPGSLHPYGDEIDTGDIDDALLQSYMVDGTLMCVPKDGGTLALYINTDSWEAAGLTDDDVPTIWEELSAVAEALTTDDQVGLVFDGNAARVAVFMLQAGGWFVTDDLTEATVDTPENLEALTYLQERLQEGVFQFTAQVEAGWGGEAFGLGRGAMTIEGPWLLGALANDFPEVNYTVVPLPAGPAGQGTMQFSNCWGVAADSVDTSAAVSLVDHLLSTDEQRHFAEAQGNLPSRVSAREWVLENQPDKIPFLESVAFSRAPVPLATFDAVLGDFDSQLEGLPTGTPPADILERTQQNATDALADVTDRP